MNCAIYNYFSFQFSYLHTFYKANNIKTKHSTKVKTYIQIKHSNGTDKMFHFRLTWDIKDEEKHL